LPVKSQKCFFSNIFKYFFKYFFEQLFDVKRSFNICIAAAAHCRWKFKGVSETPIWFGRLKTKQEKMSTQISVEKIFQVCFVWVKKS